MYRGKRESVIYRLEPGLMKHACWPVSAAPSVEAWDAAETSVHLLHR